MPLIEIHMLRGRTDEQKRKLLEEMMTQTGRTGNGTFPVITLCLNIRIFQHVFTCLC